MPLLPHSETVHSEQFRRCFRMQNRAVRVLVSSLEIIILLKRIRGHFCNRAMYWRYCYSNYQIRFVICWNDKGLTI